MENDCVVDSLTLMNKFRFTHAQARQVLSRLTRVGLLERLRQGKYRQISREVGHNRKSCSVCHTGT